MQQRQHEHREQKIQLAVTSNRYENAYQNNRHA